MILITGITGQVGSHIAKRYLPNQVVGVVRRTANDNLQRLRHHGILGHSNLTLVEGDVTDYGAIHRLIEKYRPETIIHAAASSHVHESFSNPSSNLAITGGGTTNILEAVRNANYKPQLVFFGSSEEFGSNFSFVDDGFRSEHNIDTGSGRLLYKQFPESCFQDEQTPLSANSPYAAAKIYSHNMCELYRRAYDLPIISLVCFNMEGETRGDTFVTMKIIRWLKEFVKWREYKPGYDFLDESLVSRDSKFPKLRLGNMNSQRDWTYVEDSIDAMGLLLNGGHTGTFCINSEVTRTIYDFCSEAFGLINIINPENYIVIDPEFYRPVEVSLLKGRSQKIRKLGWTNKTSFSTMVRNMWEKS